MRKYLIAGNWKMNLIPSEALTFVKQLVQSIKEVDSDVDVMIAPPFVALPVVQEAIKGSVIKLGAQNINENESGAFTGEISANMLLDLGVEYVIIGHSERRNIYKESNKCINKKIQFALSKGLKPILCVGELLEQREAGTTNDVVATQVIEGLGGVTQDEMKNVVIAYEPVWAIGTGKVATPVTAEEVHLMIRKNLENLYNKSVAEETTIQYGGSVSDTNVDELMAMKNIDGALVGGASLKLGSFTRIVKFKK